MDPMRKHQLLEYLVGELAGERRAAVPESQDDAQLWDLLRALMNTRPPNPPDSEVLAAQDELLQGLITEAGVHGIEEAQPSAFDPRVRLWRGDITTLAADAIVNAANSQMLGCWVPGHLCIDNAIHTYAGVQLRIECDRLMRAQGFEEPTGQAKVTRAFNLPSRYVIHTVGPIADGNPTDDHRFQLASSYRCCLDAAAENGCGSIAFCCISTGIFGFPQREAAEIAVATVREWLASNACDMVVVFNVFSSVDEEIYRQLLF